MKDWKFSKLFRV